MASQNQDTKRGNGTPQGSPKQEEALKPSFSELQPQGENIWGSLSSSIDLTKTRPALPERICTRGAPDPEMIKRLEEALEIIRKQRWPRPPKTP
jgi:hypothetical protein